MHVHIETERLVIRPLNLSDEKGMFEMDSDPEVHKYIHKKPLKTIEETRDMIQFITDQYKEFGIGRWAVVEKATGEFVGWTGFKFLKGPINGQSDYYDFGYRLSRRFWGKGYATESGRASLNYGIETLQFKDVFAMTDVDNAASRRILEKLGFRYKETFCYDELSPTWRDPGQLATWYELAKNPDQ